MPFLGGQYRDRSEPWQTQQTGAFIDGLARGGRRTTRLLLAAAACAAGTVVVVVIAAAISALL
jgi:hypothetical protein